MIIDNATCEVCEEALALPYDSESDCAMCLQCKMVFLTYVSLDDWTMELDQDILEFRLSRALHRGDYEDDGRCHYPCQEAALPRHPHWNLSGDYVIKLCTRHAVWEYLGHLHECGQE